MSTYVDLPLAHRLRRRPISEPTLDQRSISDGSWWHS